jgi:hypothetical protein
MLSLSAPRLRAALSRTVHDRLALMILGRKCGKPTSERPLDILVVVHIEMSKAPDLSEGVEDVLFVLTSIFCWWVNIQYPSIVLGCTTRYMLDGIDLRQ